MKFKTATADNLAKTIEKKEKIEKAAEAPIPKIEIPEFQIGEAKIAVNLRLGPSTEEEILCVLYPGVEVKVSPFNKDWYTLTYQGRDCYVLKDYIKIK